MAYVTQQDMVKRFGEQELVELTDRDGTAGAIVPGVLAEAIADAESEIDAYLASRYSLPLTDPPAALTRVAADIARYRLYDEHATDAVTDRYKAAVDFLKSIAKGTVSFGPGDDGTPPESEATIAIESDGHVWDRDKSNGFI